MASHNHLLTSASDLLTELDIKEHAIVERWRSIERNRDEQSKNSKHKLSSARQATLTQQLYDQRQYERYERNVSEAYARDSAKHTAIAQLLTDRQKHDRRHLAREIDLFRARHQHVQHAREYDLTSADHSANYHGQFGPGSCLLFEGEDRGKHDRETQQKNQMNRWIAEQCRQKCIEVDEQYMADEAYDGDQLAINNRLKNLEVTQMKQRRQSNKAISVFNQALADQKRCQRAVREMFGCQDKQQEITNMLSDGVLTESHPHSVSQFGTPRPLLTHWKGMRSSGGALRERQ